MPFYANVLHYSTKTMLFYIALYGNMLCYFILSLWLSYRIFSITQHGLLLPGPRFVLSSRDSAFAQREVFAACNALRIHCAM